MTQYGMYVALIVLRTSFFRLRHALVLLSLADEQIFRRCRHQWAHGEAASDRIAPCKSCCTARATSQFASPIMCVRRFSRSKSVLSRRE